VKAPRPIIAAALVLAVAVPGAASGLASAAPKNPCIGPGSGHLLCPNLRIGTPSEMYVSTYEGKTLLHATSDVESRGRGPMEVRGVRDGPKSMRVTQRIYRAGGGHITLRTHASLHFTDVGEYFGGSYWKVHQLARFELRKVRPDGTFGPVLRTSPKLNYCLRDLERTRPGRRSPTHAHYPGTSVGWSDIYPADYDKQYIDVSGLHGCFVFTMTVDPKHLLFESNEHDNSSHRRVRLPFTGAGC
jgi:Lysyl oxidase